MDQGQKRLLLLVILLFWRSADGFKGGTYFNAHNQWSQPFGTISPHAAQSSMSEAHVTGTSAVEEVGSSLFPNRPLERGSKFNPYPFVKGGPSISQSASLAQTAPSSSVSASLPLPVDAQPSSSLTSSGSTLQGAASGLSLQTQYVASGSGPVVPTQVKRSSYPAKLVSSQSTSDRLPVSSSQEASVRQSAISYSSSSAPGAVSISQSSPVLLESSGQRVSSRGEGSHSVLSQGASSQYTSDSNAKLLVGSSQSTSGQSSPSVFPSRSGTKLATSSHYVPVQGSSSSLYIKRHGTLGQYAPASPTKYVSAPMSASVLSSRKQYASASQSSSGAQFGASTGFASQGMSHSYSGSVQSQGTTSPFAPGSKSTYASVSLSSPQAVTGPTTVQSSKKQLTSIYRGSSGAQFGHSASSAPESVGGHYTSSQSAPGSKSPYASVSLSTPQAVTGPTTVQSSRKQFPSTFTGSSGTQAGSSPRFTLQGSTAYGGSPQPQDAASQSAPGSKSPYASVSLFSPQALPSTTAPGSRKRLTSTYSGSSGAQFGPSASFAPESVSGHYTASQSAPGSKFPYASVSLSSPQGVASQSSQAHKGYSVSQSQESQRWQPSATHWTQVIRTSDAAASQGSSSSQSSPMQFSSLSSAGGSPSRDPGQFVSAQGGSTRYGDSFQSQGLSTKFIPGFQLLPYDPSVAGQGTFSASEVLSSYSSMNNQNAPAQPSHSSSSSRSYSVKG